MSISSKFETISINKITYVHAATINDIYKTIARKSKSTQQKLIAELNLESYICVWRRHKDPTKIGLMATRDLNQYKPQSQNLYLSLDDLEQPKEGSNKKNHIELLRLINLLPDHECVQPNIADANLNKAMNQLNINYPINALASVIKIQSMVRKYLARIKILIPSALYQTKVWRQQRKWYSTGKSNECELYQIRMIEQITNRKLGKTLDRIHMKKQIIDAKKNPIKYDDGFEYTETFDGLQKINPISTDSNGQMTLYYNLKFVCSSGGAQTRSLREVYHFIEAQLNLLLIIDDPTVRFINILDGDTSYYAMNKFQYLANLDSYQRVKKYIFIGDLAKFQTYWPSLSI